MVKVADGEALVRIHQVNTKKIIHARFPVKNGKAQVTGDFAIAGVSGTGARIRLDFLSPGGTQGPHLLPTGNPQDRLVVEGADVAATLIDAANPAVFVAASDLGLTGSELPEQIEADAALMALLDRLRRAAGVAMGLGATAEKVGLASPRIALVAPPAASRTLDGQVLDPAGHDITVRMLSMERPHRAVPMTGAMGLAVACRITGSVPHAMATVGARPDEIRVGHASGVVTVGAEVRQTNTGWLAESAVVFRTARRLMQGEVAIPG
jgi:hypothetical protein